MLIILLVFFCSINYSFGQNLVIPSKFDKQIESLGISKEKAAEVIGNQKQSIQLISFRIHKKRNNKIRNTRNLFF